ncbi:tetratricopeptide repeat protein [Actinomadura sp. 9N215]
MEDLASASGLVVVSGPGGVGKTTLALRWLHQLTDRYEGQLFVDLHGFSGTEPLPPDEPLGRFLRALGTGAESIPSGIDEQAALFRSLTSGRRLIVMLDNAVSAAQVRPLLPGAGSSLVVVTSRHRLSGLVVDGARFLDVHPLGVHGALELLKHLIGADRIAAEHENARSLVSLCGTLPLAVCASGARLAARRHWPIARAVAELDDEARRLAALRAGEGDISVDAVFNASYQALDAQQARAYRLLSLHPGRDFGLAAAASLVDADEDDARELLQGLVDASLLLEDADERYRFHDLVRLHARDKALESDTASDRGTALARLIDRYLTVAVAADLVLLPGRWHLGDRYAAENRPEVFHDRHAALGWLEQEHANLAAVAREAHDSGLHAVAWQICEAMWPLFLQHKRQPSWIRLHELGRAAAEACGDRRAQARMLEALGMSYLSVQEFGAARQRYEDALSLERDTGHRLGEAAALEGLGIAERATGDTFHAIELFTEARDAHADLGRPRGIALMQRHIGETLSSAGRHHDAIETLTGVLDAFSQLDEPYHRARTLTCLGRARLRAGQLDEAASALRGAREVARESSAPQVEADALVESALVAARQDDPATERDCLERALAIYCRLGSPQAAAVSVQLAELPPAPAPDDRPPPPETP